MASSFTVSLAAAARRAGVGLIDIAPVERFGGATREHRPAAICPETHLAGARSSGGAG